ncbi:hypothetical protein HN011_004039 [Eciton burchellii]|nr:hypothetical protein HN011_004039 [Eciton burchellii]
MMKLPKDWIVVNSERHPDRVYYFNVKTNETRWTRPTLDTSQTSSTSKKDDDSEKKRKDKTRTSRHSEKVTIETAQMKAIYKKIHDRSDTRSLSRQSKDDRSVKSLDKKDDLRFVKRISITQQIEKRAEDKRYQKSTNKNNDDANVKTSENETWTDQTLRHKSFSETTIQCKTTEQKKNTPLKKNLATERNIDIRLNKSAKIQSRRLNKTSKKHMHREDASLKQQKKDKNYKTKQDNKSNSVIEDELVGQANQEIFYEEMDWEPMKAQETIVEVEVVKTRLNEGLQENGINEKCYVSGDTKKSIQPDKLESQDDGPLHIVVDTNVFLSNLDIIEQIKKTNGNLRPFIVIPWTVIHELDVLKDKCKEELKGKANKAIRFIHELLASKNPHIIGQTREEAIKNKMEFSLKCPDDEILQCCLQIRELQKAVVLLSYDVNLCNKALIHKIKTLEYGKNLETINDLDTSSEEFCLTDDIFEETKAVMKNFLSKIIVKQMSEIYGAANWQTYVIIKPPWTVVTALKCAIKHWIAAISDSFFRRNESESILRELFSTFEHAPTGGRNLHNVKHILEKCSDLIEMVNVDKHGELSKQTLGTIKELQKRCQKFVDQKKLYEKIGSTKNVKEQENRATKAFLCFEHIYKQTRDICGWARDIAGMPHSFEFTNPALSRTALESICPEIGKKVADLTRNLNELLMQAEDSIKYETLFSLQHNISAFLSATDVELLDIYCCVKLKEDMLKCGLKQLQELDTHFRALAAHTETQKQFGFSMIWATSKEKEKKNGVY